jgi:hypothetical protein
MWLHRSKDCRRYIYLNAFCIKNKEKGIRLKHFREQIAKD